MPPSSIVLQGQGWHHLAPDGKRERPARCRRSNHLDPRAVRQVGCQERVFAADALMGERRNLPGKSGKHQLADGLILVAFDCSAESFNPDSSGTVTYTSVTSGRESSASKGARQDLR